MTDTTPDQPDGIDEQSHDLPDPARAAARVNEFLSAWGDGRVLDVMASGPPLYARDLQALANLATGWRQPRPKGKSSCPCGHFGTCDHNLDQSSPLPADEVDPHGRPLGGPLERDARLLAANVALDLTDGSVDNGTRRYWAGRVGDAYGQLAKFGRGDDVPEACRG